MMFRLSVFTAAIVAAAIPTAASATQLLYSLTPVGASGYSASWLMEQTPLPTQSVIGEGFALERVSGSFPGSTAGDAYLDFYFSANGGGLMISDADGPTILRTLYGAQLYTGSEAAPTMKSGTFTLTTALASGRRYSLQVVDASAVPEPASWLMMIGGFGMIGGAMRARRRVTVRYA